MSERLIDSVCPHCGRLGTTVRVVKHEDGYTKLSRLCKECGGEWVHTFDHDWLAVAKMRRLEAEVERLREALRWYADQRNHFPTLHHRAGHPDPVAVFVDEPQIMSDGGKRARKALESKP